jgi:hypothetical protein
VELADFVLSLSRLTVGAFATFFAILLWSRTRDIAWVLVVVGTLLLYAEIVYTTLERFGVVGTELWSVSGVPLFKLLLINLPMVFYIAAFVVVLARRKML